MINKDIKIIAALGCFLTILLAAICLFFNPICALVCLSLGLSLTGIFLFVTKKRYDKLSELNNYLSLVCSGQYALDIRDNTEGELSILKNNLYKVIILLRSQSEMLEKDKLYLADALADISHQLKTPLTSMMVMSDLLRDNTVPEKQQEFIGIMENQLDKMKWLITNLLKLSKLDAGTADYKKEDFSVCSALNQSLKPFLITMDLKEITFINEAKDFTVCGDEGWTAEAFGNIIKNCIEHTQKGGRLEIYTQATSIYNSVIIRDNGCGIEPYFFTLHFSLFTKLAFELTQMIHGTEEAEKAQAAARAIFGTGASDADMPSTAFSADDLTDGAIGILDLMSRGGLIASNGEGRRLVQQGGVSVDGEKVTDPATEITADQLSNGVVIKNGTKVFHKFTF